MEWYWNAQTLINLTNPIGADNITPPNNKSILSEFDCHYLNLLSNQAEDEGWQSEMCWYLKDLPADVTKDTDIVK